jgi:predicted nucleic acid-binding protein
MYLLGRAGGWQGREALWRLVLRDDLVVANASPESNRRASQLMERYADRPMDLADATLVALAEERKITRIFTLDTDFHIYRTKGRKRFEVIPT